MLRQHDDSLSNPNMSNPKAKQQVKGSSKREQVWIRGLATHLFPNHATVAVIDVVHLIKDDPLHISNDVRALLTVRG
jgi:hypothetical protein